MAVYLPSQKAIDTIKAEEGFRSQAYPDTDGVWTIGFGTIRWPDGTPVKAGDTCTVQQAEEMLMSAASAYMREVSRYILVPLNQNQIDAIASFVYNVGTTAFKTSSMLRYINQRDFNNAANQFAWQGPDGVWHGWVHDNGQVVMGLVNRRLAEQRLFKTPIADFSDVVGGSETRVG